MKHYSILAVLFFTFSSTACSSSESTSDSPKVEIKQGKEEASNLSLADQAIIKRYKDTVNSLDFRDREHASQIMEEKLSEINKIQNNYERENLQMQIYLATDMYKEAYDLINKQLKESFSLSRLMTKCMLSYYAKRSKSEYEACYADLAIEMRKELKESPQTEQEYIAGEWSYLLFMYQAGHKEYEIKLKEMLNTIEDEQLKYQFESSYELAVEQVESYKQVDYNS